MIVLYIIAFIVTITEFGDSGYNQIGNLIAIPLFFYVFSINSAASIMFLRKSKSAIKVPFILFCLITIISYLRTSNPDSGFVTVLMNELKFILFILSTVSVIIQLNRNSNGFSIRSKENDKLMLILIPSLFVVINFLMYLLDIDFFSNTQKGDQLGSSVLLYSIVGLDVDRVNFPLVGGINSYGTFVGAIFLISLCMIITEKVNRYTLLFLVLLLSCFLTLLLLDTRSAFAIVFFSFFIYLGFKVSNASSLLFMAWIIGFLFPIILMVKLDAIMSNSFLQQFVRGDGDVDNGNGRFIIWLNCLLELKDFKVLHFIGYGEYGHFGSKVSQSWGNLFTSFKNPLLATSHNVVFQFIFDTGYIGLVVAIWLFWIVIHESLKIVNYTNDIFYILGTILLIYFIYVGATEAVQTHRSTFCLIIICILSVFNNSEKLLASRSHTLDSI